MKRKVTGIRVQPNGRYRVALNDKKCVNVGTYDTYEEAEEASLKFQEKRNKKYVTEVDFIKGEIWVDYPGIDQYKVSNLGRVKSVNYRSMGVESLLKPYIGKDGYVWFNIKRKGMKIHRKIYEAFNGEIPYGYVINHKNGVKSDNRIDNLEAVSNRDNVIHSRLKKGRLIGAQYNKMSGKWISVVYFGNNRKRIGIFDTEIEAHNAYKKALSDNYITSKYLDLDCSSDIDILDYGCLMFMPATT